MAPAPPELRWRLADDDGGQGVLFEEEIERHVGKGEFRGMEFLHVRARTVINEVPKASRVPFRWTINAYRGCSHACVYCLAGETPVLMAGGRTKPIADVRAGDEVIGTERRDGCRRYTVTPVLDHWSTRRTAYRTAIEDGTALISSGDHRFLTEFGWKHVTDPAPGPHLKDSDRLLGIGRLARSPKHLDVIGRPVPGTGGRRVVAVEPLGVDVAMFDLTTGTGDFVAGGVISHNCFARPTHEFLGMNVGDDFDRRIVVKINAVERVRAELHRSRWAGEHIAMGTNTDPYQRCEGKYRLTQGIVTELAAARNPFSILTKSPLILRDLDLLAEAARAVDVRANFSIGTLDEEVWRATEPGTPHPMRRVEAVAKLNEAGVPCGVLVAPVLPGLSDAPEQLEAVVKACVEAGARSFSPILLHLRPGVRDHYLGWLAGARPELVERHHALYPRSYAPSRTQDALSRQVASLVEKHGGRTAGPRQARMVKPSPAAPPPGPRQLGLGL